MSDELLVDARFLLLEGKLADANAATKALTQEIVELRQRVQMLEVPESVREDALAFHRIYDGLGQRTDLRELKDFSNWGGFTADEWSTVCRRTADLARIGDGDEVFEAGCGSGAFLDEILRYRRVRVTGSDFSPSLIAVAKQRVNGDFSVADVRDLSGVTRQFDRVLANCVLLYLQNAESVYRAAVELLRLTKPTGTLFIGMLNDPARLVQQPPVQRPSGYFHVTRDFWRTFADAHSLRLTVVDQSEIFSKPQGYDGFSRMRYGVLLER